LLRAAAFRLDGTDRLLVAPDGHMGCEGVPVGDWMARRHPGTAATASASGNHRTTPLRRTPAAPQQHAGRVANFADHNA
jgi:hypothetical protein